MIATTSTKKYSLDFPAYPYPENNNPTDWLAWVNEMMGDIWSDVEDELTPLLSDPVAKLIGIALPRHEGWQRLELNSWDAISADDLPAALVLDIESIQYVHLEADLWLPCLCVCYGNDGYWYAWYEQNPRHRYEHTNQRTIDFPTSRIIIGHNASSHDAQFLSCEYLPVGPEKCIYIDTRALAAIVRGVHPCQRAQWEKHKVTRANNKPVPEWVVSASDLNLEDLTRDVLGIEINKSVNGWHPNEVPAPSTLFEYCAQDAWATLKLFQKLWPMVQKIYAASPVVWWGMGAVTGLRYPVGRWPSLVGELFTQYETAKAIKPALRDDEQKQLVHWGKTHFQDFAQGFDVNGMIAMRFLPARDVTGEPDSTVWSQPGFIRTVLTIGGSDAPGSSGYSYHEIRVPTPGIPGNTLAKSLASQPVVKTPLSRAPGSIAQSKKAKADWLQKRPLVDMAYLVIGLIDCFCLQYDLDAFLAVPGLEVMGWCVKEESYPRFEQAVTTAQQIALIIMEGWFG